MSPMSSKRMEIGETKADGEQKKTSQRKNKQKPPHSLYRNKQKKNKIGT